MRGMILDYTSSEAFILLDDDSVVTVPTSIFSTLSPIGATINLGDLYNRNSNIKYSATSPYDKTVDFL